MKLKVQKRGIKEINKEDHLNCFKPAFQFLNSHQTGGVPQYELTHNLSIILPLKPDLAILCTRHKFTKFTYNH